MARTRSLSQLIADVRYVGDIEGATQRHPDDQLTRLINQAIQAFRLMLCSSGSSYYLTRVSGTLTDGDNTLTLPDDFVRAYGLDIQVGGRWRELYAYQHSERNSFEDVWLTTGPPTYFRERNLDTLDLMPTSDGTYPYRLWYLPTGDDLSEDSDEFDGIAGWEDWVVYTAAMGTCTRDASVNDNYELLADGLTRIQARILMEAGKRKVPSATRRVDTRGRRREVGMLNRWKP
jgi:hypothetical protein